MNEFDRPQNKFLDEMYDDFLELISHEPSAWDIAKEKARQLDYNRKNANKFNNIKTREEYLERANKRHADKKREATSYFNDDEPATPKKKTASKKTSVNSNKESVEPKKEQEKPDQ